MLGARVDVGTDSCTQFYFITFNTTTTTLRDYYITAIVRITQNEVRWILLGDTRVETKHKHIMEKEPMT